MIENNSILQKLEGLVSRFEEVSTLITDPSVIADQDRFVKLTREYKDLSDIMDARKRYIACINSIKEAKDILANDCNLSVSSYVEQEDKREQIDIQQVNAALSELIAERNSLNAKIDSIIKEIGG